MAAERKAGTSYIELAISCYITVHWCCMGNWKPMKCIALYSLVALSTSIRGSSTRFVGSWWLVLYQPGNRFFNAVLAFSIGKQREQSSDRNWSQVDTTPMNWSVPYVSGHGEDLWKPWWSGTNILQVRCTFSESCRPQQIDLMFRSKEAIWFLPIRLLCACTFYYFLMCVWHDLSIYLHYIIVHPGDVWYYWYAWYAAIVT